LVVTVTVLDCPTSGGNRVRDCTVLVDDRRVEIVADVRRLFESGRPAAPDALDVVLTVMLSRRGDTDEDVQNVAATIKHIRQRLVQSGVPDSDTSGWSSRPS
jgi:hypothetical protein